LIADAVEMSGITARSKRPSKDRDFLRALWRLANHPKPNVKHLRNRLKTLQPGVAKRYLDERSERLIPRVFRGQSASAGFLAWAETASGEMLVETIKTLASGGGNLVQGRSRGKR
jgi:hypothetical protein